VLFSGEKPGYMNAAMPESSSIDLSGECTKRNVLPYDGYAYLIDDTEGAFTWPQITARLAETVAWRVE